MRHGNHGPQKDTRAVNWVDVAATIEALEREYGGLVKLQVDREGAKGATPALWVRGLLYRGWSDHNERPQDVVASLWPNNQSRTMAGLCFRLLHQLDHAADARRKAEGEDYPF